MVLGNSRPRTFLYNVPVVQPAFPKGSMSPPRIEFSPCTPPVGFVPNSEKGPFKHDPLFTPLRSSSPDPHLEALIQQESWLLDLPPSFSTPCNTSLLPSVKDIANVNVDSNRFALTDLYPGEFAKWNQHSQQIEPLSADPVSDVLISDSGGERLCSEGGPGSSPLRQDYSESETVELSHDDSPENSSLKVVTPEPRSKETCLPSFQTSFPFVHVK